MMTMISSHPGVHAFVVDALNLSKLSLKSVAGIRALVHVFTYRMDPEAMVDQLAYVKKDLRSETCAITLMRHASLKTHLRSEELVTRTYI